jgi:hypothetical protein
MSVNQVLARGKYKSDHLSKAADQLNRAKLDANRDKKEYIIRVALTHHPIDSLVTSHRQKFSQWLKDNAIDFVMAGHSHLHTLPATQATTPFELQCGTTLQCGTKNKLPGPEPNHYFSHTIENSNIDPLYFVWKTYEWYHSGASWKANPNNPVWKTTVGGMQTKY